MTNFKNCRFCPIFPFFLRRLNNGNIYISLTPLVLAQGLPLPSAKGYQEGLTQVHVNNHHHDHPRHHHPHHDHHHHNHPHHDHHHHHPHHDHHHHDHHRHHDHRYNDACTRQGDAQGCSVLLQLLQGSCQALHLRTIPDIVIILIMVVMTIIFFFAVNAKSMISF